MNECELIALVTSVACGISKCCSEDDITIMAAVFTQLGDSLTTVLTYRELKENNKANQAADSNGINGMKQINNLLVPDQMNQKGVFPVGNNEEEVLPPLLPDTDS